MPPAPAERTHRSPVSAARLIALCTLASRITGLARDMLFVQFFGASRVYDAFLYAFQFPNLFRRIFGEGALAAAFIPVFTRTLESDGIEGATRLLARVTALLATTALIAVLVIQLIIVAVWQFAPAGDPDVQAARNLMLALTSLMLPFMVSICVVALFASVLNVLDVFVAPALVPIVLNFFMIVGITVVGPQLGPADEPERRIYGVAFMVLLAGVAQLALLIPLLARRGVPLGWRLDWRDNCVREVLTLMGPVILGQGVLILGPLLDTQICWFMSRLDQGPASAAWLGVTFDYPLQEGALSVLTVAARLYQFPLALFGLSLAVAALPTLSRLATREHWDEWAVEVRRALRLAIFLGLLSGAVMLALAEPIVRLLFERGRFQPDDTVRAAHVLRLYGFGMASFCAHHIVLRAFYSLRDIVTPLRISCAMLPLNLALSFILLWSPALREAAFAVSAALTSTISVVIGFILLTRRTPAALGTPVLAGAVMRMIIAAGVGCLAIYLLRGFWSPTLATWGDTITARVVDVALGLTVGGVAFFGAAALLRIHEVRAVLARAAIRFGR